MNILITGSTGFVGSHLIRYLLSQKMNITSLSRKNLYPEVKFFKCDFFTDLIPNNAFDNIDIVIHLAGLAHNIGRKSKKNIDNYIEMNSEIVSKLVKIAESKNVKKFLFLSSVKANKHSFKDLSLDNLYVDKKNIYGLSKKIAENNLIKISQKSKMQIFILRSSLIYGPNVKGNLKLLNKVIEMNLFFTLPEFNNKKSMIHIDDLIESMMIILQKGQSGRIYTATDGQTYSTKDIMNNIAISKNKKIPKWTIPLVIIKLMIFLSSYSQTLEKLFGDEIYSNDELLKIGFKSKKNIAHYNETSI